MKTCCSTAVLLWFDIHTAAVSQGIEIVATFVSMVVSMEGAAFLGTAEVWR